MLHFELFIPPMEAQQIMLESTMIFAGVVLAFKCLKEIVLYIIRLNTGVEKNG